MIMSAAFSFILSFVMSYFILDMPLTVLDNAVGNGISGAASAAFSVLLSFGAFFFTMKKTGVIKG